MTFPNSSSPSSSPTAANFDSNYDMTRLEPHDTSSNDEDEQMSPAYVQLLNAITNGNLSMVKQMLDYGLNVNYIYDKEKNYSFLHLACLMGNPHIIKFLIDHGANTKFVTYDGQQPIDFIDSNDLNIMSYMLMKMNSSQ